MRQPIVGDTVHFYSPIWANINPDTGAADGSDGYNGMGAGPYAAIIMQVFDDQGEVRYVNLYVLTPFAGIPALHMGSVSEKSAVPATHTSQCYWTWPPARETEGLAQDFVAVSGIARPPEQTIHLHCHVHIDTSKTSN